MERANGRLLRMLYVSKWKWNVRTIRFGGCIGMHCCADINKFTFLPNENCIQNALRKEGEKHRSLHHFVNGRNRIAVAATLVQQDLCAPMSNIENLVWDDKMHKAIWRTQGTIENNNNNNCNNSTNSRSNSTILTSTANTELTRR